MTGEPFPPQVADGSVDATEARPGADAHRPGPWFWGCLALGWAVIAFAIHGMVADRANPPRVFALVVGLNIVNDALVAPLLIAVAVLARRLVPRWALVPFDVGLIASAAVVLYAYPLVGSWGKSAAAGFTRLPFDYAHNLLVVLGCIWLGCAALAAWSLVWKRPRRA